MRVNLRGDMPERVRHQKPNLGPDLEPALKLRESPQRVEMGGTTRLSSP